MKTVVVVVIVASLFSAFGCDREPSGGTASHRASDEPMEPGTQVQLNASAPTASSHRPPRPPTSMRSVDAPVGPVTFGSGDVDADGRPDRAELNARTGILRVRASKLGRWLRLSLVPDPSLRIQAIADLDRDTRRDILVSQSTAGCCGYRSSDSAARVVSFLQRHLVLWRSAMGAPAMLPFSTGRGDAYSGVRCGPARTLVVRMADLTSNRARRTQIRLEVRAAVVVSRMTVPVAVTNVQPDVWTHTRCRGLTTQGWALPR